jgi:uncharacterized protein (TIGR02453 family)
VSYFDQEFIDFFKELSVNNNKAWFDEHRKIYIKSVKEPFEVFVGDMILRIQEHEPDLAITPKEAIFRINRDIRFSKDKTPYKPHVSAHIVKGGRKSHDTPGIYFHLSFDNVMIASGAWKPDKEGLHRIRTEIANNLDEFAGLIADAKFEERFGEILGDKHKRIPKEFQAAYEKQLLIANKQFYYHADISPKVLLKPELPDVMMDYYLAGKGVSDFLKRALSRR